mmetsp:Transcript_42033/g.89502  ORF Transcript_42033/g.89502 Transcript_42033/m.89502 type:complete len:458 (-) Transcript_42033:278-1651(-)|eukprot:CAMPEP_0172543926 /NCGR_PEP_ID=MMETSP1067-20121228/14202_1 /TAXON_ID=265564 ORGANISM="Thalassiosira punctigera, Strain Tpunct2005C2" /NCGR_SAMPLE_ID=MMETSP1067 /ASSEMBLY_ACC=CAM_ASM_000444 /LENGTH=457 /DNA_ID=CAMNT_0013330415 /DNA_START=1 /DNA_END=1374 /DNA_ORIENTATION=-
MPPRRIRRTRIKQPYRRRPTLSVVFRNSTILETIFLVGLVIAAAIVLWTYQYIHSHLKGEKSGPPESSPQLVRKSAHLRGSVSKNKNQQIATGGFAHFSNIAQDLAALSPSETLEKLELDPFGTRTFDAKLLEHETTLRRVLTIDEIRQLFPCPRNEERMTLPDARVEQKARDFREGKKGTFLFFQHLRKAGGTNFCSLAEKNLPRKAQPHYYCMPDMGWSGNKNAGYLHSWPNDEIITRMKSSGFRIAGNEWENFDVSRHFELPAAFATSFRKPLDRALSQFRFECIEDRGCREKDVHKWWDMRQDLWNVYTKTFADPPVGARRFFRGDFSKERRNFMAKAIDTLSKFHIVLSMEWLAYGAPQVQSILGFDDVSALTKRVRPHITQAQRNDGQEANEMGSASIAKASWVPKEYLDAEQYKKMSEDLALDEVLTDVARRMFLERLVCEDMGGGVAMQ